MYERFRRHQPQSVGGDRRRTRARELQDQYEPSGIAELGRSRAGTQIPVQRIADRQPLCRLYGGDTGWVEREILDLQPLCRLAEMALRNRHAGSLSLFSRRCEQHRGRSGHSPCPVIPHSDHAPHDGHLRPDSLFEGDRGFVRVAHGRLRFAGNRLYEDVRGAGRRNCGPACQRADVGRGVPQVG